MEKRGPRRTPSSTDDVRELERDFFFRLTLKLARRSMGGSPMRVVLLREGGKRGRKAAWVSDDHVFE